MKKRIELKQPIDKDELDVIIDGALFATVYAVASTTTVRRGCTSQADGSGTAPPISSTC